MSPSRVSSPAVFEEDEEEEGGVARWGGAAPTAAPAAAPPASASAADADASDRVGTRGNSEEMTRIRCKSLQERRHVSCKSEQTKALTGVILPSCRMLKFTSPLQLRNVELAVRMRRRLELSVCPYGIRLRNRKCSEMSVLLAPVSGSASKGKELENKVVNGSLASAG